MEISSNATATAGTWNEDDMKSFLGTIAAPPAQVLNNQTVVKPSMLAAGPDWVRYILEFCQAIARNQVAPVEHILSLGRVRFANVKQEFEEWFPKCSLLFGAERDLRIVKYFVKVKKVCRDDILNNPEWRVDLSIQKPLSWDNNCARNALLFAMDFGNIEVAEYLLHDWIRYPVSVGFGNRDIFSKYLTLLSERLENGPYVQRIF